LVLRVLHYRKKAKTYFKKQFMVVLSRPTLFIFLTMKTIKFLASITLLVLLSLSCSSSDNSNDNSTPNCNQYLSATMAAQQAYTNSNTSQNCIAYKTALQNQIANCGDPDDGLQAIVTSLGNCTVPTATGTLLEKTVKLTTYFQSKLTTSFGVN
jgi:hypothetical protein